MISARTVELLREERLKLLEAIGHIESLLNFDGAAPAGSDERPRHDKPTGRPPGRGAVYDWDVGLAMYQSGEPVKKIADRLRCSLSAVKSAKRRYGWRRKKSQNPNGEPPTIKCPNCGQDTSTDPCAQCHIILPKVYANKLATLIVQNGGRPA